MIPSFNLFQPFNQQFRNTSLMIDKNGTEVERSEYFPYGAIESGGSDKYGFTGQENDVDTELMYYGARYYSPDVRSGKHIKITCFKDCDT